MARPEIDLVQLEIVQLCLMTVLGVAEPDIRTHLKNKLQITAMKTAKTHLERLELNGVLFKEMMKGKSNLWKINYHSDKILPIFSEILLKEDRNEVIEFYNSDGVQTFLNFFNWEPWLVKLQECICGVKKPEDWPVLDDWLSRVLATVLLSPTLFTSIIHPNICFLLLAVVIAEDWPSKDEIFGEMPGEYEGEMTPLIVKKELSVEITIHAYLIAALVIDYNKYSKNRDKITSYIYHLSVKYPFYQGDKILNNFIKGLEKYRSLFGLINRREMFTTEFP